MNLQKLLAAALSLFVLSAFAAAPPAPSATVPASEEEAAPSVAGQPTPAHSVDLEATRKSAERGDAAAQVRLGEILNDGKLVPADESEAAKWFRRAADQGNADGQFNLGLLYIRGAGVPKDDVEAFKWLTIANERGRTDALAPRDSIAGRMTPEQLNRARSLARSWKPAKKK